MPQLCKILGYNCHKSLSICNAKFVVFWLDFSQVNSNNFFNIDFCTDSEISKNVLKLNESSIYKMLKLGLK